ncbi:DUF6439 family protein [Crocosphaera chwakensis]|uniref:Uncharacterized protein n=1 Tax=Crocosphaera chwakensis CCY0110 TaxID=391612 RepID=A3IJN8_9CHRO|nr:DUF6439 family protein [Crocosphaera chwakensis]EAZ94020.1 hypothetical protein CY0110_19532 [Crocosphaera chwakensis CCY0110]
MSSMSQVFQTESLQSDSSLELAQILAQQLSITPNDWHRLKGDRQAQAKQQLATALVFLLKNQPDEALGHINQAAGWLDRSVSPLPCPGHGTKS